MPVWLWLLLWILIIGALAAVYVLRPVWQHQGREVSEAERLRSELLARRETVLTALRELDLDYAVGKLPEDDYRAQRAVLLREGAQILRALDEVEQRLGATAEASADVDARLEALLEQRRRERAHATLTQPAATRQADAAADETVDDMVESLLLNRRRQRRARFAGFCPHCGAPYQENDRFCGKCGRPLREPTASRRKRRAKAKR